MKVIVVMLLSCMTALTSLSAQNQNYAQADRGSEFTRREQVNNQRGPQQNRQIVQRAPVRDNRVNNRQRAYDNRNNRPVCRAARNSYSSRGNVNCRVHPRRR